MKKHDILSQSRGALFDPPTAPAAIVPHDAFSSHDMAPMSRPSDRDLAVLKPYQMAQKHRNRCRLLRGRDTVEDRLLDRLRGESTALLPPSLNESGF